MRIITSLILITLIIGSCKTSKKANCDAYSKNEIKNETGIPSEYHYPLSFVRGFSNSFNP